jgi:hypothetical protein
MAASFSATKRKPPNRVAFFMAEKKVLMRTQVRKNGRKGISEETKKGTKKKKVPEGLKIDQFLK